MTARYSVVLAPLVSLVALAVSSGAAAQVGSVCADFERRFHVSQCFPEGEHDDGDYRFKNDNHSGGASTHGRVYNRSLNGSAYGPSRDRYLHCPIVEDSDLFREQTTAFVVDGYTENSFDDAEARVCVTHPTGLGDFCSAPVFSGDYDGTPGPVSAPPHEFRMFVDLSGINGQGLEDYYSYLTITLPHLEETEVAGLLYVVVSGYRMLGGTLCEDDPEARFNSMAPGGTPPSIKEDSI